MDSSQSSEMTVEEARAKKAEMIRQVREGTPYWSPKPGWADQFTDVQIWDAYHRDAASPMEVAAILVSDVIDGRYR